MAGKNSAMVNVAIRLDKSIYSDLGQLSDYLNNLGKNTNISDSMRKEIDDVLSQIAELDKKIQSVGHAKVSNNTYRNDMENLRSEVAAIEERTSILEQSILSLIKSLKTSDNGAFVNNLNEIQSAMEKATTTAKGMAASIKGVGDSISSGSSVQIFDEGSLKEQSDLLEKIIKRFDKLVNNPYGKKFQLNDVFKDYGEDAEKVFKSLEGYVSKYNAVSSSLGKLNIGTDEYNKALRNAAVYASKIADLMHTLDEHGSIKLYDDAQSLIKPLFSSIDTFRESAESQRQSINKELEAVSYGIAKSGAQQIVVPIVLEPATGRGLASKATKIIDVAQNAIGKERIEVVLDFISPFKTKKASDALKKFQEQINSVPELSNKEEITKLVKDVENGYNGIFQSIKKGFESNPVTITPRIKFDEDEINHIKESVNSFSKELKTIISDATKEGIVPTKEVKDKNGKVTKKTDTFIELEKRLEKVIDYIKQIPKLLEDSTSKMPESLKKTEDNVNGIIENLKKLDTVSMGTDAIGKLNEGLTNAYNSALKLVALLTKENHFDSIISGWDESDKDIISKYGASHLNERSVILGRDGKLYGSFAYGNKDSIGTINTTAQRMTKTGITPYVAMHSHPNRIGASSSIANANLGSDIRAWAKQYEDFKIPMQVTLGMREVEIFNAEKFFKEHSNVKIKGEDGKEKEVSINSDEATEALLAVKPKLADALKELNDREYYKNIQKLGRPDLGNNFTDEDFYSGLADVYKKLVSNINGVDGIDAGAEEFVLLSKKSMESGDYTRKAFNDNLSSAISKSIKDNSTHDGSDQSVENEILNSILPNISSTVSDVFKISQDDTRDLVIKSIRSDMFKKAFGITDLETYFDTKSIAEFTEQNQFGFSKDVLSGLFSNTGIDDFSTSLEKVTTDLKSIVSVAKTFAESIEKIGDGNFKFGLDDSSQIVKDVQSIAEAITGLFEAYKAINGLTEGNQDNALGKGLSDVYIILGNLVDELKKLDTISMGKENADGLSSSLNSAYESAKKLFDLMSNEPSVSGVISNSVADMVSDWLSSDSDIISKRGKDALRERSAVLGADGKLYGAYAFDGIKDTNIQDATVERMKKLGIAPLAGFHSHTYHRNATASLAVQQENGLYSGDLAAWAKAYKNKSTRTNQDIIIGKDTVQVFDSEKFFKDYDKIDFTSQDVLKKIANVTADARSAEYSPMRYASGRLFEMASENGVDLSEAFTNYLDQNAYLKKFFGDFSSDDLSSIFKSVLETEKSYKIEDKTLKDGTLSGIDKSTKSYYTLGGLLPDAILEKYGSEESVIKKFGLKDIDELYDMFNFSEANIKKMLGISDEDMYDWGLMKLTPDIMYRALGIKDFDKYVHNYSMDDYLASNPFGTSGEDNKSVSRVSSLNSMLGNISQNAEALSLTLSKINTGELKIGIEDTSKVATDIGNIVDALNKLIEAYKQVNSISETGEIIKDPTESVDLADEKIEKIRQNTVTLKNTLNSLRDGINITDIVSPLETLKVTLNELSEVIQKASGILSSSKLEEEFKKIQSSAQDLEGVKMSTKAGKAGAADIISAYRTYQLRGGEKSLEEIGGAKNLQAYLAKHINDANIGVNSEDVINKEAEAFRGLSPLAIEAAKAKQDFIDKNITLQSTIDSSIEKITNEGNAFKLIADEASKAAEAKEKYAKLKGINIDELAETKELSEEDKAKKASADKEANEIVKEFKQLDKERSGYKDLLIGQATLLSGKGTEDEISKYESRVENLRSRILLLQQDFNNINPDAIQKAIAAMDNFDNKVASMFDDYVREKSMQYVDKIEAYSPVSTDEYRSRLNVLLADIQAMDNERAVSGGVFDPEQIKEWLSLLERARLELKEFSSANNQLVKMTSVQNLLAKVNSDISKGGLTGNLAQRYEDLRSSLEGIVKAGINAADGMADMSKADFNKLVEQAKTLHQEMFGLGQDSPTFMNRFAKAINSQSAQFLAQYFSFQDIIRYAREMVDVVTQTDSALIELKKVSDASNSRIQESFNTSAQTAQELGSTITDVINSTADWARLGYSVDEAEELARVTQLFQTVGDNMTQETASESLVSILQGFKIDSSQALRVVDSINEVANNFAIDTYGIGEALQRSAASFNASNTDLNKSIALVTTANAVLQNPESVGTIFKTMSARIRGAKTELEELGEEEDEYTKTTSKLRDSIKGLTGFDILEADGTTYKDIYEILLGIGKAWKDLDDVEQASLAEMLAGKRGSNALYAVLNNVEGLEDAYQTAEGAAGSAEREQQNYAKSVQYSIDRTKASLEELANDFLTSALLKDLIEAANTFLQIVDNAVKKISGIPSILAAAFGMSTIKGMFGGTSLVSELVSHFVEISEKDSNRSMTKNLATLFSTPVSEVKNDILKNISGGAIAGVSEASAEEVAKKVGKDTIDAVAEGAMEGASEIGAEAMGDAIGEMIEEGTDKIDDVIIDSAGKGIVKEAGEELGEKVADGIGDGISKGGSGLASGIAGLFGSIPVGVVAAGVTAVAAIAFAAYYKKVQEEAEHMKNAQASADRIAEHSTQMDGYLSQYRELKEQLDSGNLSEAETLSIKKQIYDIQKNIVSEYDAQNSGIDLVNGNLNSQLSLLERINNAYGSRDIAKNAHAYEMAAYKMEQHIPTALGAVYASENKDFVNDLKSNINSLGEDSGISMSTITDALGGETLYLSLDVSVADANEKIDDFTSKLLELQDKYVGDEEISNIISGLINNAGGASTRASEIVNEWGEAYYAGLKNKLEKTKPGLIDAYADSVDSLNEAIATGTMEDRAKAFEEYSKQRNEVENFLSGSDKAGVSNKRYHNIFDANQINEAAKNAEDFKDILKQTGKENKKLNKDNIYSKEKVELIDKYADTIKKANIDSVDFMALIDAKRESPSDRLTDLEIAAKSLGNIFKATGIDASALPSILEETGIVVTYTTDAVESASAGFTDFKSNAINAITSIDSVNAAMVSAFSSSGLSIGYDEEGNLTADYATIVDSFKQSLGESFDSDALFYKTANGIKLNTKEMRKFSKIQEKTQKQKFLDEQIALTKELAAEEAKLVSGDDSYNSQLVENIKDQLRQLDLLSSAYDGATSRYQKWLDAAEGGEEGDIYDNIYSTALKQADELYENGLVGTEEFRALAELFSGKDLSTASIDEVTAAMDGIDKKIEDTGFTLRDFFKEDSTGPENFLKALNKMTDESGKRLVEFDEETGTYSWDFLNTEELAKRLGTSEDVIESFFGKLKDYGFDITHLSDDQLSEIDKINERVTELNKNLSEEGAKKISNYGVQTDISDLNDLTSLEENEEKIRALLKVTEYGGNPFGLAKEDADYLNALLDEIINKKNVINGTDTGTGATTAAYDQAEQAVTTLQEKLKLIQEHPEINFDIDGDQDIQDAAQTIADMPDEIKTAFGFEPDATTQEIIDIIGGNETTDNKVVTKTPDTTAGAEKPSGTTVAKNVVDKQIHQSETIETKKVEYTSEGFEPVQQEFAIIDEETQRESIKQLVLKSIGYEDASKLTEAENALVDKEVDVLIKTKQTGSLESANKQLDALHSVDVNANVTTYGLSELQQLVNWSERFSRIKDHKVTNTTVNKTIHDNGSSSNRTSPAAQDHLNGTAHANGTAISRFGGSAYAHGNWGTDRRETALMGELGPEIVVTGSRWQTVGDNGAEFVDLPKGAIVFNHKQTEDLLSHGYVNGRAHVGGTAYGDNVGGKGSFKGKKKKNNNTGNTGNTSNTGNTGNKNNNNNNNNNKTKTDPKDFDWIERLLKHFQDLMDEFNTLGEYYTTFAYQNASLTDAIKYARDLMNANDEASREYANKAASDLKNAKYTKDNGNTGYLFTHNNGKKKTVKGKYSAKKMQTLMADVQSGKLKIESMKDADLATALEQYASMYDKSVECKNAVVELRKQIQEMAAQKLENIIDDYDALIGYTEELYNKSSALYDLEQKKAYLTGSVASDEKNRDKQSLNLLQEQAKLQNDILERRRGEIKDYEKEINRQLGLSVKNGGMVKGSQAHKEALTRLREMQTELAKTETEIYNINEQIRELNWAPFNRAIETLKHLDSQLSDTLDLFSDLTTYTDDAKINQNGISQFNLLASSLAGARQSVADYQYAIQILNQEYKKGIITESQYNEELRENEENLMSAAASMKKYRDQMISLVKDGINKESEAMSELISKRKEDLAKQKEANDYAKTVQDKTKEIAKIRQQIAAMSGDTTLATQAKIRQLNAQLRDAQADLDETREDHAYDTYTQGLDDELEKFQDVQENRIKELETSIDAQNAAIKESLAFTTDQYKQTYDLLSQISNTYGITLTDSVVSPWKNGANAAQEYYDAIQKASANANISTGNYIPVSSAKQYDDLVEDGISAGTTSSAKKTTSSSTGKTTSTKASTSVPTAYAVDKNGNLHPVTVSSSSKKTSVNSKIKKAINTGKAHAKKVSPAEAKAHHALWEYIVNNYGRVPTNAIYKKIANALGITVSEKPTSKQKNSILAALKKRGLASGTNSVLSKGYYLTDEQGIGSEAIITKGGVLRQLDAGDMVFNAKQREALWNLSKMDLSALGSAVNSGSSTTITNHYDSLLTVNGNVDKEALPELKEILKQSYEYNQKMQRQSFMKNIGKR